MFGSGKSLLQQITTLISERKAGEEKIAEILATYMKRECVPQKDFILQSNELIMKVSAPLRSELLLHKEEILQKIQENIPKNIRIWDIR